MATFITSKSVGQTIRIGVSTSTGYWKYNHNGVDSSVFNGSQTITVANANGEFTIIPCLSDGTPSGDITGLGLPGNQLTSFDGTGLTSLSYLYLQNNQITSFDGTDLTSLTLLSLTNNLLTSLDVSPMVTLNNLHLADPYGLNGNPMTATANNAVLAALVANGVTGGNFSTANGRTSAGTADYNTLIADGWNLVGLELVEETTTTTTAAPITTTTTTAASSNPTFITSQSVGNDIIIEVQTSTGYWKYNHDGSDSSVFNQNDGNQTVTVANANGEFTLISCDDQGNVSGDITILSLSNNQLTSFDGTGLTSLTYLNLINNQLTSLDNFIFPSSLTSLHLSSNQLTSFDGTGLTSLTILGLSSNGLTSLDGFIFPTSLTYLNLDNNQITSFDGTGLTSLTQLNLNLNPLTSFDGTDLTSLTLLVLFDEKESSNTITPELNNSILSQLSTNAVVSGQFWSSNGRTSASNDDYNNLVSLGWFFRGLDLITPPPSGNGKLRIKGVTTISTPSSPLFTNITLGGIILFGLPESNKAIYYRQLTFDYDPTVLAANMDEGSTYEIVMITTSNYFSDNTIAGISSIDIGGTTYYKGNAHKVGVQGVGAKGSITILTDQWSNSNPNTLIVDTPNNLVPNYNSFTSTTWRFALIKDGTYVNGTLSNQSFLGSELDNY